MTLFEIEAALSGAGIEEARAEAFILASHFTSRTRASLLASPGDDLESGALDDAVRRRILREPLTYITGTAYFMNEEYEVSPAVLVPRRETETLVEAAARETGDRRANVLDVCTGSGCVAVSLAALAKNAKVLAFDISPEAVCVAERNAARNGVSDRVSFECADMFSWNTKLRFDVITSNPPYVRVDEMASLDPELSFEPRSALTDGGDGLSFVRELCARYSAFLAPDGAMFVEIGSAQGEAALAAARESGLNARIIPDLSGRDRVLEARKHI
jgi:release factor glutamine methyltransferase